MKKYCLLLLLILGTAIVMAVPAKKGIWKTITVENGKEVKAQLKGDEFGHYWHTVDGKHYVVVDGQYLEETVDNRRLAAKRRSQAQQRRVARLSRPSSDGRRRAPDSHLGEKKGLILLVNFKDTKFQAKNDVDFYNNVANTPGYSDKNGFVGSVADYFKDQSHGQFQLTFDVVGPVTVSKDASYYGENDEDGNDKYAGEMVCEAVKLAKSLVSDWKQYDWDNDGEVDQVMIIYAGEGEADGGAESTIWPHEFILSAAAYYGDGTGSVNVGKGLKVDTYAVANEGYKGNGKSFLVNGIGTICHEFSHCLGLPDMYDTNYSGYYGMGSWSIMDGGCYNGDGFIPSGYTSYEKYFIGWITPIELTEPQTIQKMRALTESDDVYIISNAAYPDEYYLLENRQQKGWDEFIPAAGMLILHVDYDWELWVYNLVNSYNDGSDDYPVNDHQRCTIFHADGQDKTGEISAKMEEVLEKYYDAKSTREADRYLNEYYDLLDQYNADVMGDVYPQPDNNRLSNTSVPRAFLYNKNSDGRKLMNISITDITQNKDGSMSFKFAPDNSGTTDDDNTDYGESHDTAIRTVEITNHQSAKIFTIDGRYVGSDSSRLGRGVFIINGKKIVK